MPGLLLQFCRSGQAPAVTRRNNGATGDVPARAALSRATTPVLFPGRLRSQYFFCVMSLMAQGAHRGRPVAAAPCTPGLRPATSPLRGTFDLSLQASGRAEAASVQNTALSPHPCGLPRPSRNVSAMLRPPAPAVSAASGPAVIWDRRPGQAPAATRQQHARNVRPLSRPLLPVDSLTASFSPARGNPPSPRRRPVPSPCDSLPHC
ncbi:hypothetical protein SB5544_01131 [Klebsiella variicola]|nr:hypothetical protein SB5544_01131 [Klebsiella variicola]